MSVDDCTARVAYRPIPGYAGYWAGDDGTIWCDRSTRRTPNKKGVWIGAIGAVCRQVLGSPTRKGYLRTVIRAASGLNVPRLVHNLVLEAFVGPCPPGMEACHFPDRDKTNNRPDNLRWDTPKGNAADRKIHGTDPDKSGSRNGNADLDEPRVSEIKQLLVDGRKNAEIARLFGVRPLVIHKIKVETTWTHVPWPGGVAPEKAIHAKLTKSQADEIRGLSARGATGVELARRYGVSKQTVCNILKGKIFKEEPSGLATA